MVAGAEPRFLERGFICIKGWGWLDYFSFIGYLKTGGGGGIALPNVFLLSCGPLCVFKMSRGTRFPTKWHLDKCRLGQVCANSFKLRNSKSCSVSSLTFIESFKRLAKAYAQADLRLCWSHIPHFWNSHVAA